MLSGNAGKITVAVTSAAPAIRRACLDLFDGDPACELVALVGELADAVRCLPLLDPDVIVVDGDSPWPSGSRDAGLLISMLRGRLLWLRGTPDRPPQAMAVETIERLPSAVREAVAAGRSGRQRGSARGNSPRDGLAVLSPREREVVGMIAQSYSYKEIAARLGVGISTIGTHMHHVYEKLGVSSRHEIVQQYGLVTGRMNA